MTTDQTYVDLQINGYAGYMARRFLEMIPVLLGITLLAFIFMQLLPGDPITILTAGKATPETIAALRAKFGLDKPVLFDVERFQKADSKSCGGKYFAMLSMDKSITNISSKKLMGWLAEGHFSPLCGTVVDAYLFGDLKVRLKEKRR